jgi:hypothetical protein
MGIFERRKSDAKARQKDRSIQNPANLGSPQGWFDRDAAWPPDAPSRYTHLFESPMVAELHLEDAATRLKAMGPGAREGDAQERLRCLESYYLAVQALQIESYEMGGHKATFGRLCHFIREHLASNPEILYYRAMQDKLEGILGELEESGDGELLGEVLLVREAREKALEAMPEPPKYLASMVLPPVAARKAPPAALTPESTEEAASLAPSEATLPPDGGEPPTSEDSGESAPETGAEAPADSPASPSASPSEAKTPQAVAAPFQAAAPPLEATVPPSAPPGELGKALTAENIFRVLLEECLKDGKISQAENRAIQQIRQILQVQPERHRLIAETVQADFKSGALRGSEDMNPLSFFEKICRLALESGSISPPEQILLQVMATYLHITREEFQEIRLRIQKAPVGGE